MKEIFLFALVLLAVFMAARENPVKEVVVKEVPKIIEKQVVKEVIKEVPKEVIKVVVKEVPQEASHQVAQERAVEYPIGYKPRVIDREKLRLRWTPRYREGYPGGYYVVVRRDYRQFRPRNPYRDRRW